MLTLRKKQLDALRFPLIHRQILDLVDYVRRHFPEETDGLTGGDLYDRIRETVNRAEKYGIRAQRDIYKYVSVSMLFGLDFDEKEETSWAVTFLTDEKVPSPSQRVARLFNEACYRLEIEEHNASVEKDFHGS